MTVFMKCIFPHDLSTANSASNTVKTARTVSKTAWKSAKISKTAKTVCNTAKNKECSSEIRDGKGNIRYWQSQIVIVFQF